MVDASIKQKKKKTALFDANVGVGLSSRTTHPSPSLCTAFGRRRGGSRPLAGLRVDKDAFVRPPAAVVRIDASLHQRLVAEAGDALFGATAVEGHSFLLARARNINAGTPLPAENEALNSMYREDEVPAAEHPHEDPTRSVSEIGSTPETGDRNGEGRRRALEQCAEERLSGLKPEVTTGMEGTVGRSAMRAESGADMEETEVPGEAEPGETGGVDASWGKTVRGGNKPSGAEADDSRPGNVLRDGVQGMTENGGRLRERKNELGGGILGLLRPLLDGFIGEDKHRRGTLPVDVFRRVLADCHGALWPGLGRTGIGGRVRGRHDHQAYSADGGALVQRRGGRGGGMKRWMLGYCQIF